jgi:REP element-mobilizing transposase RayT
MPSPRRDERPGFHHVWCRGNNKRAIVVDDHDRRQLVARIGDVATEFGWSVHAYCVMDNHYHLVIEIGLRGMSDGFCKLNTGHATAFNARHGRVNHLFGKRYGNKYLEDEPAFLWAVRYVVLNPVRAGVVRAPEHYRWSSYRATIGIGYSDIPIVRDLILGSFHRDPQRAEELFANFVGALHPRQLSAKAT